MSECVTMKINTLFVLPQKQKERKQMERMEKEKQNPVRKEEVVTTVCSITQTTADEKLSDVQTLN